jgi:hypothetical protein
MEHRGGEACLIAWESDVGEVHAAEDGSSVDDGVVEDQTSAQ